MKVSSIYVNPHKNYGEEFEIKQREIIVEHSPNNITVHNYSETVALNLNGRSDEKL